MFSFNTRVLFLLAKFTKFFQKDVDKIISIIFKDEQGIDAKEVFTLVMDLVSVLPEAEETAYELLSAATSKPLNEIKTMDGYEFIKQFRMFLSQINWEKLLGESMGLVLVPAKPAEKEQLPTE